MESTNTSNIVREAAYFILHGDKICEQHLLGSRKMISETCNCRINQPKSIEYTDYNDRRLRKPKLLKHKDNRRATSVSFYGTDGKLLENMKLNNIDIDEKLCERTTNMLDPTVRFVATGIYICPYLRNDYSLSLDFTIGEKKERKTIKYYFDLGGQTREQTLAWIKGNPYVTSHFDVSRLDVYTYTTDYRNPCNIL
ncbi:MAG: hypothetical protein Dasosvirus3_10 [Dasosvirus sp.]|uniref:Uncharacterized protein n=1 Tax=Dasosvirus sp. TaxID=2487764 RepID=A0A3G4ZTX3_9VIRU|nr:MAG: hypothetical protein Dasosvirus3_10 [Dasosvirus sp.]